MWLETADHGFLDSLNLICSFGLDIETVCHYSFHFSSFTNERTLLNGVLRINNLLPSCETSFVKLPYGDESFNSATNTPILNASIKYILSNKRFKWSAFIEFIIFYLCFDFWSYSLSLFVTFFISFFIRMYTHFKYLVILFFCLNCIL